MPWPTPARPRPPLLKLQLLGRIADRWLELGAIERARPILLEGQKIVAAWPKERWLLKAEEFADVLAAIDLPAAIALVERRGGTNVSPSDCRWPLTATRGRPRSGSRASTPPRPSA